MKKLLVILIILLSCSLVYGKGSRSGGSRSSSFRSTPSRSYSKPTTPKNIKPSTSRPSTNLTQSKTNQAAYKKAASQGKAFKSKSAAVSDFKSKAKTDPKTKAALQKDYPTKYSTEPTNRPNHIPQTYNNQPVTFNNGGYGYYSGGTWNPLMTYMLLDTMSDTMMMSSLSRHGYYVGATPVSYSFAWFWWILTFVLFTGIVTFLIIALRQNHAGW